MENLPVIKRKRGQHGPLRHGGYSFLTKGEDAIPKKRAYVRTYLQSVRDGFCRDLGGEAEMTTAQVVTLDRLVTALGIVRLIEEHVRERGVIANPQGFLNPALSKGYVSYLNQVRLSTVLLEGWVKERAKNRQDEGLLTAEELGAKIVREFDEQEKAKAVKLEFEFAKTNAGKQSDAQPVPPKEGSES